MFRAASAFLVLVVTVSVAQDELKVTAEKGKVPQGLAKELQEVLEETSYAISEGEKEVLHVWIRREVDSNASSEPPGYDSVEEGTFIGVYEVKDDSFTDFRGQDLPVGVFTLRLSSHPQDGNHMGISPSPQFLCLAPVADDTTLAPIERKALMDLSKKAAKTGHPATLFLEPFFEAPTGAIPAVRTNDLEHSVLDVKLKAKLGDGKTVDLPMGIIIVGETDAE